MLRLHAPRIFATAWTSLGDKTVLTFVRLGGRGGRGLWRAMKGKPIGRVVAVAGMAVVVGGLAYTYLPNGDYEPIREGERGTLGEGVAALAEVPEGRPALIAQERAAEEGRLEPDEEDPATTSTTTTVPEEEAPTTTVTPRRTTPPVTEDVPSRNQRSRFPRSRFPRSPRRPQPDVGRRRNRER